MAMLHNHSNSSILRFVKRAVLALVGQPNFLRRLQWPGVVRLIEAAEGQTIVDLGAGPMYYSIGLARLANLRVIAVDINLQAERVSEARRHGVMPVCASGYALPLADKSVDRILMSSLLHMVPDPSQLLSECRRVLRSDGGLVLSVPNEYRFLPYLMERRGWGKVSRFFRLPESHASLVSVLNERFFVGGPRGYYSFSVLSGLLHECGFRIEKNEYLPRRVGSLFWELGILGYLRFGNMAFHALFLAYPIAYLCDKFSSASFVGSEHLVKATIDDEC